MPKKSRGITRLKRQNRGKVLKLAALGQATSRVELAEKANLSKMAVSNIVSEMIGHRILADTAEQHTPVIGRNPIRVQLASAAPKIVGVLIQHNSCQTVLCSLSLQILRTHEIRFAELTDKALIQIVCRGIDALLRDGNPRIAGIGVGCFGPIDANRGVILNPPDFYGIQNVPIVSILKGIYHLPVHLDNLCRGAALAENYIGLGRTYKDFIFLGITYSLGSGFVLNGNLLKGANGLTHEIGHVSIDYRGPLCSCGNRGCIRLYSSTTAIVKRIREETGLDYTFEEACRNARKPAIDRILREALDKLAFLMLNYANLFAPDVIVIGLEGSLLPQRYLKMLESTINSKKASQSSHRIRVLYPYLKEKSTLLGSACNILDPIFCGLLPLY
ncbi:MAG TPA: hypothetical protein DEP64_09535 [Ruminococcaceae bacterium]|jgi:predicted NBD/HSP70 family sugar kinase|nr:hypothetical protein [Oscillospiraceae bacterium]